MEQTIILHHRHWTIQREPGFQMLEWMGVPHSRVLICPNCRRAWAELLVPDEPLAEPVGAFCEGCGYTDPWRRVPGSILLEEGWGSIDTALLDALPEELLRREFSLHMMQLDKETQT